MKPKIRSSVSTVVHQNNVVEFFLSNTRRQVMVKVPNEKLVKLILTLDGSKSLEEISDEYQLEANAKEAFLKFLKFLERRSVLVDASNTWESSEYNRFRRVMNFLEDYSKSSEEKFAAWSHIRSSHVVIIGLGAVGTWIAFTLAQSGVKHFTFIDSDVVDITNIHRQLGFGRGDVGHYKIDVLERKLQELDPTIKVNKVYKFLQDNVLSKYLDGVDLVINCADKPSVDTTSLWVGMSCMERHIPHIIAGGYNLHLSLIGQTILPFESACVKCFEVELSKLNPIDTSNFKKLHIENRKIGSFGPMCSISASIASMEAIKVLSKIIQPANLNRRGEFDIYSMNVNYVNIPKVPDCQWCGPNGIYRKGIENGNERRASGVNSNNWCSNP
ncbi:ThiF family adenylyltransferase [Brevibacillus brevis]|nr:ThiF family adenylyltransferase [Brevibacillus brevis]